MCLRVSSLGLVARVLVHLHSLCVLRTAFAGHLFLLVAGGVEFFALFSS